MSHEFIKGIAEAALEPKYSVIECLKKIMGHTEPARAWDVLHASEIMDTDFCPRRVALMELLGRKRGGQFIPPALRATFDMGKDVATRVCEHWGTDKVYGDWECRRCRAEAKFCIKPKGVCHDGHGHDWRYVEVRFEVAEYSVTGSLDLLMNLGAPRLFVIEVKIMAPEEFAKLKAPLAEHRLRTNLYLHLVEHSGSPIASQINLSRAMVLYVSRGFGNKNDEHHGQIIPFKEYEVKRDDSDLAPYLAEALDVKRWRLAKLMPAHKCTTPHCQRAKGCPVVKDCYSGKFPASL